MKIIHLLISTAMFSSLIATPVLAASSTSPQLSGQAQIKKEIAACQKRALEKYLQDDKTAWEAFEKAKRVALETYQAALAKAKETKSKEAKLAARQALESARKAARETWHKAHKAAHHAWKTERAVCKSAPVQQQ